MSAKIIPLLLLIALSGLSGCDTLQSVQVEPMTLQRLEIRTETTANGGTAIPVDIVFARDKETLADLEGYTADGWFTVKEIGLGDWQEKTVIQSIEAIPGQTQTLSDFPEGAASAVGVVIYAQYREVGLNRLIFTGVEAIELVLMENGPAAKNGKQYLLTSPPESAQQQRRN